MYTAEREMRALNYPLQMEVSQGQRADLEPVMLFLSYTVSSFLNLLSLASHHIFFKTPILTFLGSYKILIHRVFIPERI
jgi:hypothetical protein